MPKDKKAQYLYSAYASPEKLESTSQRADTSTLLTQRMGQSSSGKLHQQSTFESNQQGGSMKVFFSQFSMLQRAACPTSRPALQVQAQICRVAICIALVGLFFWANSAVSYAQQRIGIDLSPNPAQVNQPLLMTMTITNDTGSTMATVPLSVTYDINFVSYNTVAGSTPAADSAGDIGQIDWTDVTGGVGLADGASTQVVVHLTAKTATTGETGCPPLNTANMTCVSANIGVSQYLADVSITPSTGKYSIGDTVWHDINNDGIEDTNEPGINEVLVYLYEDTGGSAGLWDAGDTAVLSTTTAISGTYLFTNVVGNKNYVVRIDPSNFEVGGPLEGFVFSGNVTDSATGGQFVNNLNTDRLDVNFSLYCRFDLALDKKLDATQPTIIAPGDDVTYTINIYNQGIVTASNVMVVDYIPNGFMLSANDGNGWTPAGGTGFVTTTIAGTLTPSGTVGSSTAISIVLTAGSVTGVFTNTAEIVSADSSVKDAAGANLPDADSTADNANGNTPGEDANLVDDVVDEDGKNNGDEDDHDIAPITVTDNDIYDMALIKELAPGQAATVQPSDSVTYVITVKNQGTVNSGVVTVEDQIPAGMRYVGASGRAYSTAPISGGFDIIGATGPLFTTVITDMVPNSIAVITLTLQITDVSLAPFRNWAEITTDGGVDIDSDPDDNNGNDTTSGPPATAGDPVVDHDDIDHNAPNNNRNVDEDDSDYEDVDVQINYDMALIKELAAGQSGAVQVSDLVTYVITIKNQGNVNSGVVEVQDTIPAGMSATAVSAKAYGTAAGGSIDILGPITSTFTTVITDLVPSAIAQITLTVQVDDVGMAPFRNWAEITTDGGADADSDPGDNNGSDPAVGDGGVGGDPVVNHNDIDHDAVTNDPLDEDDSDYEDVQLGGIFDLALVKVTDATSVQVGDMVTFTIFVKNQGTVDASNVEVCDWPSSGFVPAIAANNPDPNWSFIPSYPVYSIADLNAGETVSFTLALEIDATAGTVAGDLTNQAGVRQAERDDNGPPQITDDEDGTFTGISPAPPYQPPFATGVIDQLNPSDVDIDLVSNDDDDHDIATVALIGPFTPTLAISKVLNTVEPVSPGRSMSFTIMVTNTGDITITYLPLEDTYNRVFIAFQDAQPPTADNADDGIVNWTDLVSGTAGLAPQDSIAVTVNFLAAADTSAQSAQAPCTRNGETCNVAKTVGPNGEPPTATPPGGGPPIPVPPVEDEDDVTILSPTAVTLAQRSVVQTPNGTLIRWRTVNESNIIGFYLWQSNGTEADLLTEMMLMAQNAGQSSGAAYSYLDENVSFGSGDSYVLEIVYADGRSDRTTVGAANGRINFLPTVAK